MALNGRVSRAALARVQKGPLGWMHLERRTARDFKRLRAAAKRRLGRRISIAAPAGAYRSYATQAAMKHAASSRGTWRERRHWGLNPNSTASLASAGYSTHGYGKSVDIVGTPIDSKFKALARAYGFRLTIPGDPNHFGHN